MARYKTKQGDCLSSIAAEFGFKDYQKIYNHPENAELKKKRPNPNIILPGDEIFIPEKSIKQVECEVGKKHRFVVKFKPVKIKIHLLDNEDNPLSLKKYSFEYRGQRVDGKTDSDGFFEAWVPADLREGALSIWDDQDETRQSHFFQINIGHLDPIETVSGVQARLKNLGFYQGEIDGILGERTREALIAFQKINQLKETGDIDEEARKSLAGTHDK